MCPRLSGGWGLMLSGSEGASRCWSELGVLRACTIWRVPAKWVAVLVRTGTVGRVQASNQRDLSATGRARGMRPGRVFVGAAILAVVGAGCTSLFGGDSPNPDCIPTEVDGAPLSKPDRRFEDIVERLTGYRLTAENEGGDGIADHPNFGGIWGDFQGGIVVAVLDCSKVDANELAYLAGGAEYLYLIEVPYTERQWYDFRIALWRELYALGIEADVNNERTQTGRMLEVRVRDVGALPDSFGSGVPDDAYVVVEAEHVGTVPAG